MCGISGIVNIKNIELVKNRLDVMNESMKHRGPDDSGVFNDDFVGLTQTRLSIIDLSSQGHQPMISNDKNCIVVFNGEIYNFLSLKKQLSDYQYHTKTDTEVIIAAYQKWGINFIHQLDGMFAIALYDVVQKKLFLIRDRLGVKPLYFYTSENGESYFASELRTIIKGSGMKPKLNKKQLQDFLTFQTSTGCETLIENISSITAGSYLCITTSSQDEIRYWQAQSKINASESREQAVLKVKDLFFSAVEKRLMADVPLGAFLSGGIDSSAVVAAMSECGVPINTFNVNFSEGQFSEAKYAQIIADKFKTNHTEINLSPDYFLNLLPQGILSLDHPSTDGLNTYVVSKATKDAGITVALSGVGGDEWFAGYPAFQHFYNKTFQKLKLIPQPLRALIAKVAQIKTNETTRKKWEFLSSDLSFYDLYTTQKSVFSPNQIKNLLNNSYIKNSNIDIQNVSELSIIEWEKYLMPVLLRDTDQMGMAHSLEIREPFLDYQLIEYVLSLPDEFKFGKEPKQLLVDAMGDLLPDNIVNRPKMGFVLPYQLWMKNELKTYVKEGLNYIKQNEAFNTDYISHLEAKYFSNQDNVRWNMIWILAVLGHWINNNNIQ
jgi:asparagine synthase (glutamine-hydrolysing)